MKCKYCGADIHQDAEKCEYCGSFIDHEKSKRTAQEEMFREFAEDFGEHIRGTVESSRKAFEPTNVKKAIKGVTLAILISVFVVVVLIFIGSFLFVRQLTTVSFDGDNGGSVSQTAKTLPIDDDNDLFGEVVYCDGDGNACIKYDGQQIQDVIIKDKKLLEWLDENDRGLEGIAICFHTDADGNISEIGLQSNPFVVLGMEGDKYVAARVDQIICISSEWDLYENQMYNGYFTYPDMTLMSMEDAQANGPSYMDMQFDQYDTVERTATYTGEQVTVHRVSYRNQWFYCSEEVYNAAQNNETINGFTTMEDAQSIVIK